MERFRVPRMSCAHCVQAISKAVKGVDPTAEIAVDLAAKEVVVTGTASSTAIAQAIRAAGYANEPLVA